MRILFVLPYPPSPIRVRPYHFIRELANRNDIHVLASSLGRDPDDGAGLRPYCRDIEIFPVQRLTAARNSLTAVLAGLPIQATVSQHPQLDRRLQELLETNSFDVVHVEHLRAAQVASVIPPNVPTLFDSVDSISLLQERTLRHSHSLAQRLLARIELGRTRAFEGSLLARFDRVVATSPEDAHALESLQPAGATRRVDVVTNGVDLDKFYPSDAPREPATLVMSGKMSYHANVSAIIHFVRDVFPLIRRAVPDVRLRIVGSKPPPIVRELTRDPAITVTGYVPEMRMALEGATIAICPVTVKVGVQNKVLEAMAMATPVVCTRTGFQGLSAEPGRDLLVADSDQQFADDVCRLLAQPILREQIGQSGRRYIETNHRWSVGAERLERLYAEVIALKTGRLGTY